MSAEVRQQVFVRCGVAHAFAVFTRQVDAWWPPSHRRLEGSIVRLDPPGPDGRLCESSGDRELEIGFVTDWNPPRAVALGWFLGAPTGFHTRVRITFEPRDGGTFVEVVHVDGDPPIPDWEAPARIFRNAWAHVLAAFTEHAEEAP